VWAWAPTPNGTEFIPIYNGTGPQAVIGPGKLASWAEDWVHAYGRVAIGAFEPSIIIWVSYYIRLPNGSVELVAQPFYRPINLSFPLSGGWGIVVNAVMGRPFITVVNASGAAARGSGKASDSLTPILRGTSRHCLVPQRHGHGTHKLRRGLSAAQSSRHFR